MTAIIDSIALGTPPTGRPTAHPPAAPTAPTDLAEQAQPARTAPTDLAEQAQPGRAAPGLLAQAITDPDSPPFALNHARILYASALAGSAVSVTGGTGGANVLNPATYSRWSFTGSQTMTITLPAARNVDAVGLAAHNFAGASVAVEYSTSDGGAWVSFGAAQSGQNAMLFLLPAPVSAKRLRVTVTGAGPLVLGVVYAGVALQMQRPIYKGHEPGTLCRVTEYQSAESEGGQWLGRNIIRQGLKTSFAWSKLGAAWFRQYFDPFVDAARSNPFFISWNPADYPREVVYAWTTSDVSPTNTGPRDLMSVSINVRGAA